MKHLDLLLPFGLPPAEMAPDLIRQSRTPALASLLARGKTLIDLPCDPFSRCLPHEHWLSQQLLQAASPQTGQPQQRGNSPPAAPALLRRHATTHTQGYWFIVQPAHLHVARDHLLLTDIDQLALDEDDAQRLFHSAQTLFAEAGRPLLYLDASTWLMRADDWADLLTSSAQAASGRNIDIWMPEGSAALAWRKLQNEVQMQWFSESLNNNREKRGQKAVNSLWLWGGGDARASPAPSHYQQSFNLSGWAAAASPANQHLGNAAELLASKAQRALLLLDRLQGPGLQADWGDWLAQLESLEQDWFAVLLPALRKRQLESLSLLLSGQERLLRIDVSTTSLRQFWRRPGLHKLGNHP